MTAADVRAQLRRGLSRRAAARALGVPLSAVDAILRDSVDPFEQFAADRNFREVGARGKRCAECGAPAADHLGGRPLCREHLCPDPDPDEERERHFLRMPSALGAIAGKDRDEAGGAKFKDLERALDAACARHGIPSCAHLGLLFGTPLEGGPK